MGASGEAPRNTKEMSSKSSEPLSWTMKILMCFKIIETSITASVVPLDGVASLTTFMPRVPHQHDCVREVVNVH